MTYSLNGRLYAAVYVYIHGVKVYLHSTGTISYEVEKGFVTFKSMINFDRNELSMKNV